MRKPTIYFSRRWKCALQFQNHETISPWLLSLSSIDLQFTTELRSSRHTRPPASLQTAAGHSRAPEPRMATRQGPRDRTRGMGAMQTTISRLALAQCSQRANHHEKTSSESEEGLEKAGRRQREAAGGPRCAETPSSDGDHERRCTSLRRGPRGVSQTSPSARTSKNQRPRQKKEEAEGRGPSERAYVRTVTGAEAANQRRAIRTRDTTATKTTTTAPWRPPLLRSSVPRCAVPSVTETDDEVAELSSNSTSDELPPSGDRRSLSASLSPQTPDARPVSWLSRGREPVGDPLSSTVAVQYRSRRRILYRLRRVPNRRTSERLWEPGGSWTGDGTMLPPAVKVFVFLDEAHLPLLSSLSTTVHLDADHGAHHEDSYRVGQGTAKGRSGPRRGLSGRVPYESAPPEALYQICAFECDDDEELLCRERDCTVTSLIGTRSAPLYGATVPRPESRSPTASGQRGQRAPNPSPARRVRVRERSRGETTFRFGFGFGFSSVLCSSRGARGDGPGGFPNRKPACFPVGGWGEYRTPGQE
ncbi:hypothetical protein MARPO_0016s0190 [Marchantia polymorpha]|uniref:Uncharacterized protein n=1 Tax=Marchantia polymorpha TaxID=3197 RepID=A0A2R6XGB4_MARPO|nr:hypothetical protein MARPO_0016s0190 [Marchantia polymorpha]|eukprot:PTQ45150.1 hypothetical protein MARPO_0016s0190 [Marchantia polymorpha]